MRELGRGLESETARRSSLEEVARVHDPAELRGRTLQGGTGGMRGSRERRGRKEGMKVHQEMEEYQKIGAERECVCVFVRV